MEELIVCTFSPIAHRYNSESSWWKLKRFIFVNPGLVLLTRGQKERQQVKEILVIPKNVVKKKNREIYNEWENT